MILHLEKAIAQAWGKDDPFARARQQHGKIFREKEGRRTLRFAVSGQPYFLKLHQGIGWREIIKNLAHGRAPVLGAAQEWRAIQKLHRLGVPTLRIAGYGRRGWNPARQLSFLITYELRDAISLDRLCAQWRQRPDFAHKLEMLRQTAQIARTLHHNGVNHRDFYLCHFLLPRSSVGTPPTENPPVDHPPADPPRLHVMDLHRAQIRRATPRRWLIKDLGGLYFSALDARLTSRDRLRFMAFYRRKSVRQVLRERAFWRRVRCRAHAMYRRDFGREPPPST